MDNEAAERWEIDQDSVGNPLMRHRHTTISIGAYLTTDAEGRRLARCPDCGEQIVLAAQTNDSE